MALVGLPGAGKTSVAPLLAARLGAAWDDLDARIERESGMGVPELLRKEGEEPFRERERRTLEAALSEGGGPAFGDEGEEGAAVRLILACGGGAVTNPASWSLLAARATVVWLAVRPETAIRRLGATGVATRPLLAGSDPVERLRALAAEREPLYGGLAAVMIGTDDADPERVAAAVETALRRQWAKSES